MENKKSLSFIKIGIILNLFEYAIALITFVNLYIKFDDFTIMNRYVTNKQMQSSSFFQMLQSMIYSGEFINYIICSVFVILMIYLSLNTIFIILETVAFFKLKKNKNIEAWKYFIISMGLKGILCSISSIPLFIGGMLVKSNNNSNENK